MKKVFLFLTLLFCSTAFARTWTDNKGRTVQADVIKVYPNKTVKLKSGSKTFTLPFSSFSETDIAYLETLLSQPEDLHPVPWEKMNELFGLPLWSDSNLWNDPCSEVGKRINLNRESQTPYLENYRAYPLGSSKLFGEAVYAVALYGDSRTTESLSLVFLNLGDLPESTPSDEIDDLIEAAGERILSVITPILGDPERDSLGKDALREKVWRWNWNGHAIMLSQQEGKYTALRIMPTARADNGGQTGGISDKQLKSRLAECVDRRANGDVIIRNIPMINQGPKGYCVPATWERYLRYMDIPIDMYLLALAAGTGRGGGTYTADMNDATENIIGSNGRKLGKCGDSPDMDTVSKQIDKGLPILWTLYSTPAFQRAASENTLRRNGKDVPPRAANQDEDTSAGGHMCLIIGYNRKTGEIAISDSWGPHFAERWVPQADIEKVSDGEMNIIKW